MKTTVATIKQKGIKSCGTHTHITIGITQIIASLEAPLANALVTKLLKIVKATATDANTIDPVQEAALVIVVIEGIAITSQLRVTTKP